MAGALSSRPGRQPAVTLDSTPDSTGAAVRRLACTGPLVLQLHGELDFTGAAAAEAAVRESATRARVVIIDLAGLAYLDCAALRALARARAAARQSGGDVLLAAAQPPVRRLLSVVGADAGVMIRGSLPAAQQLAATACAHTPAQSPAGHRDARLAAKARP